MNLRITVLAVAITAALTGCPSDQTHSSNPDITGPDIPVVVDYGLAVQNWSTLWAPLDTSDPIYDPMSEAKVEKVVGKLTAI